MERRCSVSIDLDPIPCYYRIHGLGPAPDELRHVIMRRCVPRFAELFARKNIKATFFVVGEDVDVERHGGAARSTRAALKALHDDGHEIGNHSYSHPYELARLGDDEVALEIGRADELLRETIGEAIAGFRGPGYDLSAAMMSELCRLHYRYDSSIFPAPAYYLAKAAVMAALHVVGRPSGAVMTNPRALFSPIEPYRPSESAPWQRGHARVVELPVAVTPVTRTPAIGTSLLLAPSWLRGRWMAAMRKREFFNFELHGIDLADAGDDGIPGSLVARQPDLRVPLADKLETLESVLDELALDYDFSTLAEVADSVQRTV